MDLTHRIIIAANGGALLVCAWLLGAGQLDRGMIILTALSVAIAAIGLALTREGCRNGQ